MRSLAVDLFYSMKTIELQIDALEVKVAQTAGAEELGEIAARRRELRSMETQYNAFLDELGVLDKSMSEEDRLIFRVARIFGECELYMPDDFLENIKTYITVWQQSERLPEAIHRASRLDLAPTVYQEMVARNLPPQFFYLALQESDFDSRAVGPKTRFGIAKGMWQFMPATANQYGLRTGPLVELAKYDPTDERFDALAATRAAADYLEDIYGTDAQASGLLVLASYNWGPTNIKRRIRQMPQSPRERNFWELLKHHDVPAETRRYVFLIFSAAVIGENPSLFGFDFQNPLEDLDLTPGNPTG